MISDMIKKRWVSILLIACGIVLIIGGISLIQEYYGSGGVSSTIWTLFHGILMIIFAIGLVILGIRNLQELNR